MPLPVSPTNYGPPLLDFSVLGDLGNEYYKGAENRRKYDLSRAFQNGIPRKADGTPDTQSMYEILAQHGSVDIPNLQDQADRNAIQRMVAPGGQSAAPQPAALAPQAATGAAVAPPQRQQPPGTGDFRSATPAPNVSRETSPQNEGALAQKAAGGDDLWTLAVGLTQGANVPNLKDIVGRIATARGIDLGAQLTPEQERDVRPILDKAIKYKLAQGQGAAQPVAPQAPPAANEAVANLLPPGHPDPKEAVNYLRTAGDRLAGNPRGKDLAEQYYARAAAIESAAFGSPEGFERAGGGQRPIAGGPKDPAYLASVAEAGVKPVPVKIGVGSFGEEIYAVPVPGGFRRIDPKTGQLGPLIPSAAAGTPASEPSGLGARAPAKESAIPTKDLELDRKAGRNVEYLQGLEPEQQGIVRKVANYEINPASLSIKGGHRERVLSAVAQFDPSYDQKNYLAFADGLKKFGASKEGNSVRSFNVGIEHIDQLLELGRALDNSDIPKLNEFKNWVKTNLGQDAPTNFSGLKAIVGAEIVKAIVGAGGTGEERAAAARTIASQSSREQLEGVAKTYGSAMGAQLIGLQRQYEQSTGRKDFDRLLSPQAIRARDSHNAPAVSGAGNAVSAAPPMAERKVGQTYPTPKGPMTWTGTGWLPAQPQ